MIRIEKILSGGQTGVDRAVLDFAIVHGIPYGGTVPKNGWAEDFPNKPGLLAVYSHLTEGATGDPAERTRANVVNSSATLIINPRHAKVSPGTSATKDFCKELSKPYFVTTGLRHSEVIEWLDTLEAQAAPISLNIAGPRESESLKGYAITWTMLNRIMVASAVLS